MVASWCWTKPPNKREEKRKVEKLFVLSGCWLAGIFMIRGVVKWWVDPPGNSPGHICVCPGQNIFGPFFEATVLWQRIHPLHFYVGGSRNPCLSHSLDKQIEWRWHFPGGTPWNQLKCMSSQLFLEVIDNWYSSRQNADMIWKERCLFESRLKCILSVLCQQWMHKTIFPRQKQPRREAENAAKKIRNINKHTCRLWRIIYFLWFLLIYNCVMKSVSQLGGELTGWIYWAT